MVEGIDKKMHEINNFCESLIIFGFIGVIDANTYYKYRFDKNRQANSTQSKRASPKGCPIYGREVDQIHGPKVSKGTTLSLSILFFAKLQIFKQIAKILSKINIKVY